MHENWKQEGQRWKVEVFIARLPRQHLVCTLQRLISLRSFLNNGRRSWTCIVQTGVHYNLTSSKKRSCISSIDKWPSDNQPNSQQHLTKGQKLQEKEAQHTVSAAIKIVGSSTLSWLPVVWSLDIMALAWRTIHNQNQKTNDLTHPSIKKRKRNKAEQASKQMDSESSYNISFIPFMLSLLSYP